MAAEVNDLLDQEIMEVSSCKSNTLPREDHYSSDHYVSIPEVRGFTSAH